jgi:hypothetical protein
VRCWWRSADISAARRILRWRTISSPGAPPKRSGVVYRHSHRRRLTGTRRHVPAPSVHDAWKPETPAARSPEAECPGPRSRCRCRIEAWAPATLPHALLRDPEARRECERRDRAGRSGNHRVPPMTLQFDSESTAFPIPDPKARLVLLVRWAVGDGVTLLLRPNTARLKLRPPSAATGFSSISCGSRGPAHGAGVPCGSGRLCTSTSASDRAATMCFTRIARGARTSSRIRGRVGTARPG